MTSLQILHNHIVNHGKMSRSTTTEWIAVLERQGQNSVVAMLVGPPRMWMDEGFERLSEGDAERILNEVLP
jgi:hypothetical protein